MSTYIYGAFDRMFYHVTYAFLSESTLYSSIECCFEQGVPWHSGNYRVWIHSETRMWHNNNIQLVLLCLNVIKNLFNLKTFEYNLPYQSSLQINENLSFESFHVRMKCNINSLSTNRIHDFSRLSHIQKALWYLNCSKITQKRKYFNRINKWLQLMLLIKCIQLRLLFAYLNI